MSIRLTSLTPTIEGAPGETVVGRIQVHNDGAVDSTCTIGIVGLETNGLDERAPLSLSKLSVPAGSSANGEVTIRVPITLGIGQHAAAFEVVGNTPGDRASLLPFTLSISSVARVELTPNPATIRGRRRAGFHVDIANHEAQTVDIVLDGEAPDVRVRFSPDRFRLAPGQRSVAKGSIKGPRHITGEITQHNILISARGRAATTSVNTAYVQRPLFAHRLRGMLVAVTVVALWLGAIGGVALWLNSRDSGTTADAATITAVDTNGDGIPDSFVDANGNTVTAVDTNGDGIPDSFFDANGNPIAGTDTNGDGIPDTLVDKDGKPLTAVDLDGDGVPDTLSTGSASSSNGGSNKPTQVAAAGPTSTVVRGTVKADGDTSNVSITLAPIALGAQPDQRGTPMGFAGSKNDSAQSGKAAKIWPARFGRVDSINATRQSQAIAPIVKSPQADGVWLFTDVALRQTYEIVFAKPGFDTQSFVVTPPADGSAVDLDVDLKPARGSLSGIVTGTSGAGLGGVAITVTDGTLSFETTSATDGKIGTWSLEGVSTPSVYSITGTLRGYGTEVRQVELKAGNQRNDVNLAMKPGVGAISGRVADIDGRPLGGVAVTATNGEQSITTSTLTEGDIGSYNLPQLTVPANWTVTVEQSGYLTQTRRTPLAGSISNVDFVMSSESLRLTGRVMSSTGDGIVNAGLTLTTGDLTFKVSSAAVPDAGAFSIDNLPPGNYTVTAEHYKHATATELITLTAGIDPPPLNMTLEATGGLPPVGNGSLVVSVLDADPLADPQGIVGATVTLVLTRTGEIARTIRDSSSANVRIDKIPVGTYTLLVTAPGYNSSIATQVSIGLQEERRDVRLQQLGQASGMMIDSITRAPVTGYAVYVWQERAGDDFRYGPFFGDKNGFWQTPATALGTGTYRIEVDPAPEGYKVRPDQKLDNSLPDGTLMRFVVRDGKAKTKVVINDIEADPYPAITGRISKPKVGPPITFVPIDDPTLAVSATCNGKDTAVQLLDKAGTPSTDKTLYDEFSIGPLAIAAVANGSELPTSCTVTMQAQGTDQVTYTLNNVDAANAGIRGDRRLSAALVTPAGPTLSGTTFWYDGSNRTDRIALDDVTISTAGFITGFTPVEGTSPEDIPSPQPIPGAATSTTSKDGGKWTIVAPSFGTTTYKLVRDGFQDGTMPVTVDAGDTSIGTTMGLAATKEGGSFAVELQPPNPGNLIGQVTIETSTPPEDYIHVKIAAKDPFGATTNLTPDSSGHFEIADAAAGTWTVTFELPPNHAFFGSGTATVSHRIEPGQVNSNFNTEMVELGTVTTVLRSKGAPAVALKSVNAEISLTGTASHNRPLGLPDSDGNFVINQLEVATTTPKLTPAPYIMAVVVPGYAVRTAIVEVNGVATSSPGAAAIPFDVHAGQNVTVDILIEPLGERVGKIQGANGAGNQPQWLSVAAGQATVTALRVTADGTPLPPDTQNPDPLPIVRPITDDDEGGFTLSGPAGYYKLEVSHPEYHAPSATRIPPLPSGIPSDTLSGPLPPSSVAGVYQIADGDMTPIGQFTLDIIEGNVSVRAVDSLATPLSLVLGARYHVFPKTAGVVCTDTPATTATEMPSGSTDLTLAPGVYCLQISKVDGVGKSIAFPAITTITVARAVNGVPSQTTVVAPLPALVASITGTITATNTLTSANAVELPDPSKITMTSSFDPNQIKIDSDTTPNENPPGVDRSVVAVAGTGYSYNYTFTDVPAGLTKITAPNLSALGYTLATPPTQALVDAPGPLDGPTFTYTVASSDVRVPLSPAADTFLINPGATLTSPSNNVYTSYSFDAVAATFNFTDVAPEAGNWTLSFTDALHEPVSESFPIPLALSCGPAPAACYRTAPAVTTTGKLARLSGSVQMKPSPTGTLIDLPTEGKMVLQSTTVAATSFTLTGPRSSYIFDVPPDTYDLTITSPGYIKKTFSGIELDGAGTTTLRDVVIDKAVVITVKYLNSEPPTIPATLAVQLLQSTSGDPILIQPDVVGGKTFSQLPAGTYQVQVVDRATTNKYPTYTGERITYGIGQTPIVSVQLPRLIGITVNGVTGTNTSVTVVGTSATMSGAQTQFNFSSVVDPPDASRTIPATGSLSVKVGAPGYRTQVFDAGEVLQFNQSLTLLKDVVVTGAINAPAGTFFFTAPGGHTATATITDSNTYSVTLGVGDNGEPLTWTSTYDLVGVGKSVPVTTTVKFNSSNPSPIDIAVQAQDMKVDFSVTDAIVPAPPDTPIVGAAIKIGSVPEGVTDSDGKKSFMVKEAQTPIAWTVKKPDFLWKQGNVTMMVRNAPPTEVISIPVSLTKRTATTITGTFKTSGPPTSAANAPVKTCEITDPDNPPPVTCAPVESGSPTGSDGAFTFTTLLPGSYRLWVGSGAQSASFDYTINGFSNRGDIDAGKLWPA